MPMYDFVCTACGNKFEDLVFGDEVPACPKCNSAATEKQMCVPSPLKTGAFPYKPGAVRPMGKGMPPSCAAGGGCGGCGGNTGGSDA